MRLVPEIASVNLKPKLSEYLEKGEDKSIREFMLKVLLVITPPPVYFDSVCEELEEKTTIIDAKKLNKEKKNFVEWKKASQSYN